MKKLSHRERVLAVFQHEKPDRIPLDMMGNATMLLDKTYLRLRDHLGLPPIPPVRSGSTANYYDERILDYFDIDFRRLFLRKKKHLSTKPDINGIFTDAWGIGYKHSGDLVNAVRHPLKHQQSVAEINAFQWPAAADIFDTSGLAETARQMYQKTDFALVARNPLSEGFLERACQLMGMEAFLMSLILNPEAARCILDHLLRIYKDVYAMFLKAVGPFVQMVEVGDDLGSQHSTIISQAMYREFIKPAEKELYQLIHELAPGAALFRHCDGAITSIIPDLIEVGVDILNPVQTSLSGMNAQHLKKNFGSLIVFHGAIENIEGDISAREVEREVKEKIDHLAPGGGYILASCNHMIDVSAQNIITIFKTADAYGRY